MRLLGGALLRQNVASFMRNSGTSDTDATDTQSLATTETLDDFLQGSRWLEPSLCLHWDLVRELSKARGTKRGPFSDT